MNTPLNEMYLELGFPGGASEESVCQCKTRKRQRFDSWMGKIPCRGAWQPAPVFLPGEPVDRGVHRVAESNMTEAT